MQWDNNIHKLLGNNVEGDASLAKKVLTVETVDKETYSTSSATSVKITNQFEDADINRFDTEYKYLSRSNWLDTLTSSANYKNKSWTVPSEMLEALIEPAMQIVEAVHSVLEKTPPELSADISDRGIYMTGGGCLIDGLDRLLQEKTGINVMIADDAVSCVALGTGKALDNLDNLERK